MCFSWDAAKIDQRVFVAMHRKSSGALAIRRKNDLIITPEPESVAGRNIRTHAIWV
jgi:hypothetical protein